MSLDTKVIQLTNVAPVATKDQMKTLFGFVGRVEEVRLYPEIEPGNGQSRVCYVKFSSSTDVGVSLHLTNTVFVDRALVVTPVNDGKIPDESTAMALTGSGAIIGAIPTSSWASGVVNQVTGSGTEQMIETHDPRLSNMGLPAYPPLPATTDPNKLDEIRRTVYASCLDNAGTPEQVLQFFTQAGEVKYVRMAGDDSMPTRSAFIEFSEQTSIPRALSLNSALFLGKPLRVGHASSSIIKPPAANMPMNSRELEEAMKKVKEAQSLISAAVDPDSDRRRSRSRSRGRGRRSRSRRRSHSRTRRRSRSRERRRRSRSHGRRSKSRTRRRSTSRSRRKSRSPRRRKSRSRSRERHRRSRSRDKRSRRSRSRSSGRRRSRSRERRRRSHSKSRRSRSRSRSPKSRSRKDKKRDRSRDRDSKSKKKHKDKERERERESHKTEKDEAKEAKVRRDYDEEEKLYSSDPEDKKIKQEADASGSEVRSETEAPVEAPPGVESQEPSADDSNLQQEDMDMDSD